MKQGGGMPEAEGGAGGLAFTWWAEVFLTILFLPPLLSARRLLWDEIWAVHRPAVL